MDEELEKKYKNCSLNFNYDDSVYFKNLSLIKFE